MVVLSCCARRPMTPPPPLPIASAPLPDAASGRSGQFPPPSLSQPLLALHCRAPGAQAAVGRPSSVCSASPSSCSALLRLQAAATAAQHRAQRG